MTDVQVQLIIAALGGLFVILGFLIKYLINTHVNAIKATNSRIDAQNVAINDLKMLIERKTESLNHVFESRCKEIEATIKSDVEILSVVNGKYTSRADFQAMVAQRSEWRQLLMDRLNKSDELVERIAKFKDLYYNNDKAAILQKISELERTQAVLKNTVDHFCK